MSEMNERSVASAGSAAGDLRNGAPSGCETVRSEPEPVAWALMRRGQVEQVAVHPVYLSGDIHRVAPLYAHQPQILTAAEREAVERAIDALHGVEDMSAGACKKDDAAAATLRGLLARLA